MKLSPKVKPGREMKLTTAKITAGVAVLAGILSPAVPAFAASTTTMPTGGTVKVFVTPMGANGEHGTILIIGAIGDWGTTLNVNANGTADPNGNYARVSLQKGTFLVNLTSFNAVANKVQPTFYGSSCSAVFSVKGPIGLSEGTGGYKGISGTLTITETYGFILPRYASGAHAGQCNTSNNAQPLAQHGDITGSGTVGFS
jgi:hypothetical protein